MLLLVGLGNPGPGAAGNRHNIGFMAVDEIVRRHSFSQPRHRFRSECYEGMIGGEKLRLLKPLTYMNESGAAVGEAVRFYKLDPGLVTVIHDELDLAPGKIRVKTGGGVAGHNGLRSIDSHIGRDFRRLRIGIGHPGDKNLVTNYVLRDFPKADCAWVEPLIDAVAEALPLLVAGDDAGFMNRVTTITRPPDSKPAKTANYSEKIANADTNGDF